MGLLGLSGGEPGGGGGKKEKHSPVVVNEVSRPTRIPQCIKLNARTAGVGAGGAGGEMWVGLRMSGRGASGGGAGQWLLCRNPCSQKEHLGGECHKVCILP